MVPLENFEAPKHPNIGLFQAKVAENVQKQAFRGKKWLFTGMVKAGIGKVRVDSHFKMPE